jgi:hypothetical protein
MFLPDYVESGFDHATIQATSGAAILLVKQKSIVYEGHEDNSFGYLPHPLALFIPLAFVALLLSRRDIKRKKLYKWFDALMFGATGLIGILLLVLWTLTDHQAAAKNFNLLWALPTNLIVAFALFGNRRWLVYYFYVVSGLLLMLLLTWPFLPQKLNLTLLPIVIVLLVRSLTNAMIRRSAIQ